MSTRLWGWRSCGRWRPGSTEAPVPGSVVGLSSATGQWPAVGDFRGPPAPRRRRLMPAQAAAAALLAQPSLAGSVSKLSHLSLW